MRQVREVVFSTFCIRERMHLSSHIDKTYIKRLNYNLFSSLKTESLCSQKFVNENLTELRRETKSYCQLTESKFKVCKTMEKLSI